jgi:hypothetical protein
MSNLACHAERSEGSLPDERSFAALSMTTIFTDQMRVVNPLILHSVVTI